MQIENIVVKNSFVRKINGFKKIELISISVLVLCFIMLWATHFNLVIFIIFVIPTTFMLWVFFSPVPECVVISLLETSFPDPLGAPGHRYSCYVIPIVFDFDIYIYIYIIYTII